jgi:uncharacterized protein with LGFP repeats
MGGAILDSWVKQGFEQGTLGYPVSDEVALANGRGAFNWFQRGAVYWSPSSGAHWLTGPILDAWVAQGFEGGPLGFPVGDHVQTRDGGAFTWFEHGAVYWSPDTGAHRMAGPILDAWVAQGFEGGPLGYPTSDPYQVAQGTRVDFEGGSLIVGAGGQVTRE